jgi:hypothetical protein
MRNFSGRSCRENQNTHSIFNNVFPENSALCEIMWKNTVELDSVIWHPALRVLDNEGDGHARTHTHTLSLYLSALEYITATAFLPQQ